ncbi:MAG: methyltransferase, partial [Oscillospiraceae bacterium]
YKIALSRKHRFTTDAVLLYNFSKAAKPKRLCDLCSGTGIIALLHNFKSDNPPAFSLCVEIDDEAVFLLGETLEINKSSNIEIFHGDLRLAPPSQFDCSFDTVTCNPPYFKENSGLTGESINARQEIMCNIEDVCSAASKLLKYGGRFFVCQRPERLVDLLCAMRKFGIEPKSMRTAYYSPDKSPFLVLAEGKKGGKSGFKIKPDLFITKNGEYTEEYRSMAGME